MEVLQVVTAPTVEPITLAEAKRHCKIEHTEDDALIADMIVGARELAESMTDGRALCTQTWDWVIDGFPAADYFKLPKAPTVSVTSITYYDTANTSQTLATTVYQLLRDDRQSSRIVLKLDQVWPSVASRYDAVTVRFVAGYGAASAVPYSIKQAIKMIVGHWDKNREAVVSGTITKEIELAVESLLGMNAVGSYV